MQDNSYQQYRKYYEQYADKIYAYLYHRSGRNKQAAEDLTSEVFLKALENFSSFDPRMSPFGAWIYRIARNHLIDHYRVRKTTVALEDVSESRLSHEPEFGRHVDSAAELDRVLSAIDTMPDNYREILTLKFLNGLENEEIEKIIGKSQGNIRVLIHRSLASLNKMLEQSEKE